MPAGGGEMKRQTIWQQALVGMTFGLVISYIKNYPKWYWVGDEYMVGQVTGAMIGGGFLYCLLYRFFPRKK